MLGVFTILFLGFGILTRGQKSKQEFYSVQGAIVGIEKTLEGYPNRHEGKMRYLVVAEYPKPFELFIGKEAGDFKPAFEQLDMLRKGDIVTIYYDEETNTQTDDSINRLAQFIDKGQQPYFIRGNHDKYGGYAAIAMGALIGVSLLLLKKTGKIS